MCAVVLVILAAVIIYAFVLGTKVRKTLPIVPKHVDAPFFNPLYDDSKSASANIKSPTSDDFKTDSNYEDRRMFAEVQLEQIEKTIRDTEEGINAWAEMYDAVEENTYGTKNMALMPECKKLNRYKNILAYDHSFVLAHYCAIFLFLDFNCMVES